MSNMIIYTITAKVYVNKKNLKDTLFEVRTTKQTAKETKSCYVWEGRRLAKDKLLNTDMYLEGQGMAGYRIYSLEADVEKAREIVTERLRKYIENHFLIMEKMKTLVAGEPILIERDRDAEQMGED